MDTVTISQKLIKLISLCFSLPVEFLESNISTPFTAYIEDFDAIQLTYLYFGILSIFNCKIDAEDLLDYNFCSIARIISLLSR